MSTAVAAAASFLTPIATPTNLMVMGPGGYACDRPRLGSSAVAGAAGVMSGRPIRRGLPS
jgi:di/tricarboxylate transporter